MHTVTDMLHIECADGQEMPYLGYISVTLTPYGTQLDSLSDCLFLIVPTSTYSTRTPVLIGTNIITRLLDLTRDLVSLDLGFCRMLIYIPLGIWHLDA